MTPILAALAIAVVAGAVLAVSAADGRLALVGLVATLSLAPLVATTAPDPVIAGARIAGGVLAAYLLRVAVRGQRLTVGSRIGWLAESLAAGAAFLAGAAAHEATIPGIGPAAATAAGCALVVLAVAPLLDRRDPLRQGLGLLLAVNGADLVRSGLAGPPDGAMTVTFAGALVLLAAVVAALTVHGGRSVAAAEAHGPRAFR